MNGNRKGALSQSEGLWSRLFPALALSYGLIAIPLSSHAQTFSPTGSMAVPRREQTATLLPNGKVLMAGGRGTLDAELYDPSTGTFSATGRTRRFDHTATLLRNGKVLFAGGMNSFSGVLLSTAELYDPNTGTFTPTGDMTSLRAFHTATLLPSGKVLLAGGLSAGSRRLSSAELYDPATGAFSATGPMSIPRDGHTATLLGNGKVLVAGNGTADLYDPSTGMFSPTGAMINPRSRHTATLLLNGKVLLAGSELSDTAELYDPDTGTFSPTGDLMTRRGNHTATLLFDGKVLVAGGNPSGNPGLASAELFDPSTGTFSPTGVMSRARTLHAATILLDGRVLVAGGSTSTTAPASVSAELYTPASLSNEPPDADAGPDQTIECGGPTGAYVMLNGLGSSDPDGETLQFAWKDSNGNLLGNTAVLSLTAPLGTSTYSLTVTDPDGASASDTVTVTVRDTTAPATLSTLPAPNASGWYKANVLVTLTAADGCSGVQEISYSLTGAQTGGAVVAGNAASVTISSEGTTTLSYFARDNAGNQEGAKSLTVRIDKTPPTISVSAWTADNNPYTAGTWTNQNVTVHFACSDSGSGLAPGSPPADTTVSSEGSNLSVSGTCWDRAGNSASATFSPIKIDKTAPTLSVTLTPRIDRTAATQGVTLTPPVLWPANHRLIPVTASITWNDTYDPSLSIVLVSITSNEPDNGLGDGDTPVDIDGAAFGTDDREFSLRAERSGTGSGRVYTVIYRATDDAGNPADASAQVIVPLDQRKP